MSSGFKYSLVFIIGLLMPFFCCAQLKTYQFEQIDSLQKLQKKPVAVFIHTHWCQYCQAMKNTTFKNKAVITLLNTGFYTVFLNAEEKREILFGGRKFPYLPTGTNTGENQLAKELASLDDITSFPTVCFINSRNEIIYQYNGFMDSLSLIKTAEIILKSE